MISPRSKKSALSVGCTIAVHSVAAGKPRIISSFVISRSLGSLLCHRNGSRLARTVSAPRDAGVPFFRFPVGKTPADLARIDRRVGNRAGGCSICSRASHAAHIRRAAFSAVPRSTTRIGIPFGFAGGRASVAHIMPASVSK
jgi:hypothetical protein